MTNALRIIVSVAIEVPPGTDYRDIEGEVLDVIEAAKVTGAKGVSTQFLSWDLDPDHWWHRVVKKGPVA